MKIIKTANYIREEQLGRRLLEWAIGCADEDSFLYAMASSWSNKTGVDNNVIQKAINELDGHVTEAQQLQNELKQIVQREASFDTPMGLEDDNPVPGIDY